VIRTEAGWLATQLGRYDAGSLSPLIHVGSSTRDFRVREQSWIHELIEVPLERAGVEIVNTDLKSADGVDIAGDLSDPAVSEAVRARSPRSVLCANILEHVADAAAFARACCDLVEPGGLLFVTVPRSYPRHDDPIDSLFRPSPPALHALFSGTELLVSETLDCGSFRDDLRRDPLSYARHPRAFVRMSPWLFKNYRVSCIVARKVAAQ
jgi:hypothetical protein